MNDVSRKGNVEMANSVILDRVDLKTNQIEINAIIQPSTSVCSLVHAVPGRVRFRVPRLSWDGEYAKRLQKSMEALKGVTQVRVNPAAASIAINYTTKLHSEVEMRSLLASHIQNMDLRVTNTELPKPIKPEIEKSETEESFDWSDLTLPALATILALLKATFRVPIPQIVVASSVIAAGLPVAKRAGESLVKEKKLNIDCLDVLALGASSLQGDWLTPALLLLLHETGDAIRDRTARSSACETADLLDSLSHFAWVEEKGEIRQVAATEVKVGDTVVVYPGEQIPVDGKVIKGEAAIDQQRLTGESMPVVRRLGESVFASTLVRSGKIYIETQRVGNQTRAGASIELVKQAPVHDTRMENYASNVADKAILPALALAGATWAITRDSTRVASILSLDFVTGIRLAIPTTFLAAINHAAKHGILIRSGRTLEQLAKVDTIVFDKTGTLTQGDLQIVEVDPVSDRTTPQRLLQLAASAEQRLTHPLAEAVVHYAESQNVEILPREELHFDVGLGVSAEIDGEKVLVGSDRFLRKEGISIDCFYEKHPCILGNCGSPHTDCPISANSSVMYIASNGEFQGVLKYADPLRIETKTVLEKLRSRYGLEIHLLTGDNQARANAVGRELAMKNEQIHAEAFPEVKAEIVRKLHESGKTVAFVGDGLNDSVALAYADVSISFAGGSEVARETADVVLMNDELWSLLDAIAIAKETMQITHQNIGLSVVPNLAAIGIASTIGLNPLLAAVVHNGSAIAAGVNGLRPLLVHRYTSTINNSEQ